MASLSVGVSALTWGLSFALLEPYYLSLKRKQLVDISREIGELPDSVSSIYAKLAAIERSTTVHISIVAADGSVAYDSNSPASQSKAPGDGSGSTSPIGGDQGRPPPFVPVARPNSQGIDPGADPKARRVPPPQQQNGSQRPAESGPPPGAQDRQPPELRGLPLNRAEEANGKVISSGEYGTLFETMDPRLGVRLLFLSRKESSGKSLVLSFPLAQAAESARGTMFFLSISCIFAILTSALLAFFLARSATRPFGELVDLSRAIASLDFSRRFVTHRDDEVSVLGGEMNELADNLQRALAELEATNAKLREDVEREKRVDAMRREFISSVSHELKTPIALILGYAEGIQEGVPNDVEARDAYLAVIVDEAKKMDEQVKDLLELSQIESGLLPLSLDDFDLKDIVTETLASFDRAIAAHGIEPALDLESIEVRGDRRMLARAFVNFFSNAISHIDENRAISIRVERMSDETLGDAARLSIFNSGAWIPKNSLDLIWNSYYKVDPSRKREFGGTGLGLAIVRGIIARHGGQCSVENLEAEGDLPRGVLFSFAIPTSGPAQG
jgi:Signal transduction histidine kinase